MVTRTIKIGKCTIIMNKVPPETSEEELIKVAKLMLININMEKAKKEVLKQFRHAG